MVSSTSSKNAEIISYVVVIVIIAVIFAAVFYVYKAQQLSTLPPEESQTRENQPVVKALIPTPTPRHIPSGKMDFMISTGSKPNLSYGWLDPRDPGMGGTMTITVKVTDVQPVQMVWAIMKTDNKTSDKVLFHRIDGTDLSGNWQGKWVKNDTYNNTLFMTLEAQSESGHTKIVDELL